MIVQTLLDKCKSESEKETAIFFDSLGFKCLDLNYEIKSKSGEVVAEADGIFYDKKNNFVLVYDDSTQSKKVNQKIRSFINKWSDVAKKNKILMDFKLHTLPIYVYYIDKARNKTTRVLDPISDVLGDKRGVLFKDDIEYFYGYATKLRVSSRNDFLNYIGVNSSRPGTKTEVIQIYIDDTPAYVYADRADEVLKYSYVSRRRGEDLAYQRSVNFRRINKIKEDLLSNKIMSFPNSILLNSEVEINSTPLKKEDCPGKIDIFIPSGFGSCKVVDGQHRLYSFALMEENDQKKFNLPIVLLDNLDRDKEVKLFLEINNSSKRVDPSLQYDLISTLNNASLNNKEILIKKAVKIVNEVELQTFLVGKLYKGSLGQSKYKKVTLSSFVDSLISNGIIENPSIMDAKDLIVDFLDYIGKNRNNLDYFLSNRGIDLLLAIISYDISSRKSTQKIEKLIDTRKKKYVKIINNNIDELKKYQGLKGRSDAKQLIIDNL